MRFSEKFRANRFKHHYNQFYPAELTSDCKRFLTQTLSKADPKKPLLIIDNHDWMKQAFLFLFMKMGFVSYKLMSAYSLLDIYLGNNEDYATILDISPDVVCLYLGYGEFENKRQTDVIVQLVNSQMMQGKTLWVYCKAPSVDKCNDKYPGLVSFFKSINGLVGSGSSGTRKLSDEL